MAERDIRYIAIEGVIGVGKTTLARLLSERLNAELVLEEVEENPFLHEFYNDRPRSLMRPSRVSVLACR